MRFLVESVVEGSTFVFPVVAVVVIVVVMSATLLEVGKSLATAAAIC